MGRVGTLRMVLASAPPSQNMRKAARGVGLPACLPATAHAHGGPPAGGGSCYCA